MREKEWKITAKNKEYNIKVELPGIWDEIKVFVNGNKIQIDKKLRYLRVYILGVNIMLPIEDANIVLFINNNTIDLAIDGYFLETKKQCYIENSEKINFIYCYCIFLSFMTLLILNNWILFILYGISVILYTRITSKCYLTKKEKVIRYFLVALIHWGLAIMLKLYN